MPNQTKSMPTEIHESNIPDVYCDAQLDHGWNRIGSRHFDGITQCCNNGCEEQAKFVFVDDNSITRYCPYHAYPCTDLSNQEFNKPDANPIKNLIKEALQ